MGRIINNALTVIGVVLLVFGVIIALQNPPSFLTRAMPTNASTPPVYATATPLSGVVYSEGHIDWLAIPKEWGPDLLLNAQIVDKSAYFDYLNPQITVHTQGASALVDGNPLTAWSTSSGRFPHWIVFQLKNEVVVNRIGFVNYFTGHRGDEGNDSTKDLEVYVANADTPNDFQKLGDFRLQGALGNPPPQYSKLQAYSFQPTKAKYIKVVFKSNYYLASLYDKYPILLDGLGVALAEVVLFSSPSSSLQVTPTPSTISFWAEDFASQIRAKQGDEFIIPFKIHVSPQNQAVTFELQVQIFRKDNPPDKSYIYFLNVEPAQVTIPGGESRSFKATKTLPEGNYRAVLQYWTTREVLFEGQRTNVRMPQEFTDMNGNGIEISIEIVK